MQVVVLTVRTILCAAGAALMPVTLQGCASLQYDLLAPRFKESNVVPRGEKLYLTGAYKLFDSYYTNSQVIILGQEDAPKLDARPYVNSAAAESSGSSIELKSTGPLDPDAHKAGLQRVAETLARFRQDVINEGAPAPQVTILVTPDGDKSAFATGLVRVQSDKADLTFPFESWSLAPDRFNRYSPAFEKLTHEVYHALTGVQRLRKRGFALRLRADFPPPIYNELAATIFCNCFQFELYGRHRRSFDADIKTDAGRNTLQDAELRGILEDDGKAFVGHYRGKAHALLYLTVWSEFFGDRAVVYAGDPGYDDFMKLCARAHLGDPANIRGYLKHIASDGREAPEFVAALEGFDQKWRETAAPWVGRNPPQP